MRGASATSRRFSTRKPSAHEGATAAHMEWPRLTRGPPPDRPWRSATCPAWAAASGLCRYHDSKDSTRYLVHFAIRHRITRRVYRDEQHAADVAAYPGHIAGCSAWRGQSRDHAKTADRIVALETKLADAHWDVVKRRDADGLQPAHVCPAANRRRVSTGQLGDHWGALGRAMTELVVRQPDYLVTFCLAVGER